MKVYSIKYHYITNQNSYNKITTDYLRDKQELLLNDLFLRDWSRKWRCCACCTKIPKTLKGRNYVVKISRPHAESCGHLIPENYKTIFNKVSLFVTSGSQRVEDLCNCVQKNTENFAAFFLVLNRTLNTRSELLILMVNKRGIQNFWGATCPCLEWNPSFYIPSARYLMKTTWNTFHLAHFLW